MKLLLKEIRWASAGGEETGDLRIGNGRVLETGRNLRPRRRERTLDGNGYLALPGAINAHDHLDLNLFPKLGEPPYTNFYDWGREIYRPEARPVRDLLQVPLADRLTWSAYKQLAAGVTTVVHHGAYHRAFGRGFPVKVLRRYCWSHSLGHTDDVRADYRRCAGRPYMIHAAEGTDAASSREVDRLDELGILGPTTILVHGIALSERHWELLAARGVGIVWCPSSNLHLYGKTAPVDQLRGSVPLALGTDSTLSGAATLSDELEAAMATRMTTAAELFEMTTVGAATMLGVNDGRGTLAPGAPADVVVVADQGGPAADAAVSGRRPPNLALVLVDGKPRMAAPALAELLGLGAANATVDNRPFWLVGSIDKLRARIVAACDGEILAENPLWRLIGPVADPPGPGSGSESYDRQPEGRARTIVSR